MTTNVADVVATVATQTPIIDSHNYPPLLQRGGGGDPVVRGRPYLAPDTLRAIKKWRFGRSAYGLKGKIVQRGRCKSQ